MKSKSVQIRVSEEVRDGIAVQAAIEKMTREEWADRELKKALARKNGKV